MSEVSRVIEEMSSAVISRAQRNLGSYRMVVDAKGRKKRRRADSSGTLRKSLGYKINVGKDDYKINFVANGEAGDYANFVERGVNGTRKNWGSPFSFRGEFANIKAIKKWMQKKPIKARSYKDGKLGGFVSRYHIATKGKNKGKKVDKLDGIAFGIAKSIALNGFAPLNYMADAAIVELPKWTEKLADAYAEDIANRLA